MHRGYTMEKHNPSNKLYDVKKQQTFGHSQTLAVQSTSVVFSTKDEKQKTSKMQLKYWTTVTRTLGRSKNSKIISKSMLLFSVGIKLPVNRGIR